MRRVPEKGQPDLQRKRPEYASGGVVIESRMKFANATELDRKSGIAEWRDLRFAESCAISNRAFPTQTL
jgi:hypothetical protein